MVRDPAQFQSACRFGADLTTTWQVTCIAEQQHTAAPSTRQNTIAGHDMVRDLPPELLETSDPLTEFCATHKFAAFEHSLLKMGIAEPSELADVSDAQLAAIGFNALQLRRLRKLVPARVAAASLDQNSTSACVQASPAAVDQSVDVATAINGAE